jgi:uncharacterized membrane protein
LFELVKLIHILSAAVLFGTGAGIAFFMLMAWRTKQVHVIAVTARHVVLADWLFTTTAVFVQPVSGVMLIILAGHDPFAHWLLLSYVLFGFVGLCWLPVVWIQLRVKKLAESAPDFQADNCSSIDRLMRIWFALGWPAFAGVVGIYGLMVFKPVF